MTENPFPPVVFGSMHDAWNEGWNQAKEDDAQYLESYHFDHMADIIRAEKKVSE